MTSPSPPPTERPARRAGRRRSAGVWALRLGVATVVLAGVVLVYAFAGRNGAVSPSTDVGAPAAPKASGLRWKVQRRDLTVSVLASGELRTKNITPVRNEVETYRMMKITWIIPEGTQVRKGDKLVELDDSELRERYLKQKVTTAEAAERFQQARDNLAIAERKLQTDLMAAANRVKIAELAVKKYVEGDYLQTERQKRAEITLAEEELNRARDKLAWTEKLYNRRFVTEEDLKADRFAVLQREIKRDQAVAELDLLRLYTKEMESTRLETALEEAKGLLDEIQLTGNRDLNTRRANVSTADERHRLENEEVSTLERQLVATTLVASADGLVVYHKERGRYGNQESILQVGRTVYPREWLIDLPDFSSWILEARVHESVIQQVRSGQPCFVTLDAIPGPILNGTIGKIAVLPDSSNWMRDTQEYIVEIDLTQNLTNFKPGMSGKVEVIVETLQNVLVIPIHAVSLREGKTVVTLAGETGPVLQAVDLGLNNDRFVHVVAGLQEGQEIFLDSSLAPEAGLGPRPFDQASPEQRQAAAKAAEDARQSPPLVPTHLESDEGGQPAAAADTVIEAGPLPDRGLERQGSEATDGEGSRLPGVEEVGTANPPAATTEIKRAL